MNKCLVDYYKALGALTNHVIAIYLAINNVFKKKGMWWDYQYTDNSDGISPLPDNLDDDAFRWYLSEDCQTGAWNYSESFPIKFFGMSGDEIRAHIKREIKFDKDVAKQEAENERKLKENQAAKKKAALAKLTKEEIKLLKL